MAEVSSFKQNVRSFLISLGLLIMMVAFQNCAQTPQNAAQYYDALQNKKLSLMFNKNYLEDDSNVDMVWLVGDEVSSTNEGHYFGPEFNNFLNQAEHASNLKLALITKKNSKNNLTALKDIQSKGHMQFNANPLKGEMLDRLTESMPTLIKNGIIRYKSKKIVVVVGDDKYCSESLSSVDDSFKERISAYVNVDDLIFYSVCKHETIKPYNKILNSLAHLAKTNFTLPIKPLSSLQVKVDGVVTDSFILKGTSLVINPSNFNEPKEYVVQVEYEK